MKDAYTAGAKTFIEQIATRLAPRDPESAHGPAGARVFRYIPTYFLRGLEALHLEYTPVGARAA